MKELDSVLVVVVIYRIKYQESETIKSILNELPVDKKLDVIIYDNSAKDFIQDENIQYGNLYIHYHGNPDNPGVSVAYNYGAKFARKMNKKWLLFFDQDTILGKRYFVELSNVLSKHTGIRIIVPKLVVNELIVSPCKYFMNKGIPLKSIFYGIHTLKNKNLLNSGMLISRHLFEQSGGFNPKIKLYFSDFEFINRVKKYENTFYLLDNICLHRLRDLTDKNVETALITFPHFCNGAKIASKSKFDFFKYSLITISRAILLMFRYNRVEFLKIFINNFLCKSI